MFYAGGAAVKPFNHWIQFVLHSPSQIAHCSVGQYQNQNAQTGYEFIGCFKDANDRAMPIHAGNVGKDVSKCAEFCQAKSMDL